ncbi:inositol monophosphatase family protein [Corynebacterium sp. ES2794-CONJ1]|uniref:inositol monophosphatase family protein n=1 Tax=unclassified Corynebacterium TaxID=2624378 RepID=UPI0021678850|nr:MULTISPECIES: inositol monophosphatase family protein [unclassified Corynebacterium]MCS4489051.1 inositol monophosphatase family protein [Corynebacterium sp. ES2775-CONJ]MCS4490864.1 inositol monophosphatase family protein [Corynebacterium sp. ES2715-CONJ3]MCS4531253.1 inositol monophosphatase family protein [Corynebacterium sp. ES2730-CONJ]MCU9518622.1 inositol monophosphatase family protein [Corynebacterium sp. ES2794-CONJ1]
MINLESLYDRAEGVVKSVEPLFTAGLGAAPEIEKSRGDFATAIDLKLERIISAELSAATGIPVSGEEFGGQHTEVFWIVDPIDGTANYAAGNPTCAILMSLVAYGRPVIGFSSIPFMSRRYGAYEGSPLFINGRAQPPLEPRPKVRSHIGISSLSRTDDSYARTVRDMCADFGYSSRLIGSVGVDLAFGAAGIFAAGVSLSPHLWDNAAGVVLAQASGAIVSDLVGNPWTADSHGLIIGSQPCHEHLCTAFADLNQKER